MKAPSVVFFSGVCGRSPAPREAGHKAGAAGIPQPPSRGDKGWGGHMGVLDFSTLGSLLVLTVCELDIFCNNAVLKSALFMRVF